MKENIQIASLNDISEILELQRTAFYPIANLLDDPDIQPMIQTYDELLQEFNESIILKYIQDC